MSILKSKAFLTSDGKMFATIEEAQKQELATIFNSASMGADDQSDVVQNAVAAVMNHKDAILAILSTRKPRTPKVKPVKVSKTRPAAVNASPQDSKQ